MRIHSDELSLVLKDPDEAVLVDVSPAFGHLCKRVVDLPGSKPRYLDLLRVKELIEVVKSHHILREQGTSRVFIGNPDILFSDHSLQTRDDPRSYVRDREVCQESVEVHRLRLLLL